MDDSKLTSDYEQQFDADWYLDTYYDPTLETIEKDEFLKFTLDSLHDAFRTVHVTGGRLLDVGTGPTVHSVISSSRHVDEIYLSDYAEQNRKLLVDWWKSETKPQAGIMEYVIKKENSNESASSRQNSIRNKVRGILSIDVHLENPLGSEFELDYFDVVISSLCLEVASESLEAYSRAMKNVCGLIKPGGHLILVGLCGQSFYRMGDKTFSSLPLRLHQVEDTLEHLGNTLLSMRWIKTQESEFSDTKGAFVIIAERSKVN